MRYAKLIPLCCLALTAFSVNAAAAPKFYVGLDVGSTRGNAEYFHDSQPLFADVRDSDSSEGMRLRLGFQASRFFAMEVGYADLGDFEYAPGAGTCPPLFQGECDFTTHSSARGLLTNAVFMVPLNNRFRVKGRVGWINLQVKARETGPDATVTDRGTDSEGAVFYAAGVEFHATDKLDVELGWTQFNEVVFGVRLSPNDVSFNQGKVSLASIGIAFRF
ncbi:MAG: porin family protein [Steroidobacteraceae bacterium]|nr:porin family protein [Steroidobacteraceae bacterium]